MRPLGHGLDDAQISLVWNRKIDVRGGLAQLGERALGRGAHAVHRAFEYFLPFELPMRNAVRHSLIGIASSHAVHSQNVPRFAITAELLREQTFFTFRSLQYDSRRAVAKQYGDIAI